MFGLRVTPTLFLSTPSARRATSCANRKRPTSADFYPRPPRGGRPELLPGVRPPVEISIHALREEGDQWGCHNKNSRWRFLSTPSARRATDHVIARVNAQCISIHALREEGDVTAVEAGTNSNVFLSTPSARRATGAGPAPEDRIPISIHALREEGDSPLMMCETLSARFLSTPSARRATILLAPAKYLFWNFYPRPPRGGRPLVIFFLFLLLPISIHALREEGDALKLWSDEAAELFLSTPSARRATRVTTHSASA